MTNRRSEQRVIHGAMDRVGMTAAEVRLARVDLGLCVRELAVVMGVRPQTVNRWERQGGCGGPARALLMLLKRHPGILYLLGLNYPDRPPIAEEVGHADDVEDQ